MDIIGYTTTSINTWYQPELIDTREVGETIELTFMEISSLCNSVYPAPPPHRRVFKIIYSCIDGKWNKSERIYGRIEPAQNERYSF